MTNITPFADMGNFLRNYSYDKMTVAVLACPGNQAGVTKGPNSKE